jgi:hypothetical protein
MMEVKMNWNNEARMTVEEIIWQQSQERSINKPHHWQLDHDCDRDLKCLGL